MAVSYVTYAVAGSTTATVTGVQVGDLIVVMAMGSSIPGLPAGWTSLLTVNPAGFGVRVGYKVATAAGSQTVDTWTSAAQVVAAVYRGAGAPTTAVGATGGTAAITGLPTGSWVAAAFLPSGDLGAAKAGLTNRSVGNETWFDSAGVMTSRAATSDANVHWSAMIGIPPGATATPAALDATLPGPATAALTGTSTNPGALTTALPGPPTAAIEGTLAGSFLTGTLPGPLTAAITGGSTNPAALGAVVPGPPEADMSGVIFGVIALRRPPRPLEQLLRDGTRRRDLIRIQTGPHAGAELPVTSWSLTLDHLSTIRATGQAEVRHTGKLAQLLDPRSRTELAMILAIEDDEGHIHEWQKALLHTVPLERGHHMTIQLEDRAAWVRAAGMRQRIVMPAGMDIVQAITLLLGARAPWLPVAIPLSGTVLPQDAVLGGLGADPWEIASELARSIGHRLHIDPHGIAKTAPITDLLTATPVAEWADDAADITDLQTTISDTDVVNVVGLPWTTQPGEGEPPDAITGGTEWWIDTTSSVSVAVMGDRVQPYPGDTSLIASAAQARDAAAAHGLTAQGIAISVDIPGVRFDPRRDVGDIIRVRGQRLGLDVITRLTGLTYTAGAPTMGVTLADRRMI